MDTISHTVQKTFRFLNMIELNRPVSRIYGYIERTEWCIENCHGKWDWREWANVSGKTEIKIYDGISFEYETDAVAFKLRWL